MNEVQQTGLFMNFASLIPYAYGVLLSVPLLRNQAKALRLGFWQEEKWPTRIFRFLPSLAHSPNTLDQVFPFFFFLFF